MSTKVDFDLDRYYELRGKLGQGGFANVDWYHIKSQYAGGHMPDNVAVKDCRNADQ